MDTPIARAAIFGIGCATLLFLAYTISPKEPTATTWEPEEEETTTVEPAVEEETTAEVIETTTAEVATTTMEPIVRNQQEIRVILEQPPPNVVVVREQMPRPPLYTLQSPTFDEYAAA